MKDRECVDFLQWSLPRLGLNWAGFRKVRRTVCKRVARRMAGLGLADVDAYRAFLDANPAEWQRLDELCRIPISRFWRDRGLYDCLAMEVLPALATAAATAGRREVRAWSAGCASGEEPYTLQIAWAVEAGSAHPDISLSILATDVDETMLARARAGIYAAGSLKELSATALAGAFDRSDDQFLVRDWVRTGIVFERQDLRQTMPAGPFDLVLCRNVAFTYFDEAGRRRALAGIQECLRPGGVLAIGAHEALPEDGGAFTLLRQGMPVFRYQD